MERECGDGAVGLRIEGGVARAIGVEADDETGERTADEHTAIGLQRDRVERRGAAVKRCKAGVGRAVGVEAGHCRAGEHEDATVALNDQSADDADGRVKRGIGGAVGENASEVCACSAVGGGEAATDEHPTVGLRGDCVDGHRAGATDVGGVASVESVVVVETGDAVAGRSGDRGEGATDEGAATREREERGDGAVRVRLEGGADGAVVVNESEIAAGDATDVLEATTEEHDPVGSDRAKVADDDQRAVRTDGDGLDGAVCIRVKGSVEGAGEINPS